MTNIITVLIPVLGRPYRVEPLLASLQASESDVPLEPLFLASQGDNAELEALRTAAAPFEVAGNVSDSGQWAKKINYAFRKLETEWALCAADDLDFRPGWADEALAVAERTGACVIGTNDQASVRVRSGRHSCHPLVHRDYLECGTVDAENVILTELYDHNYPDDECCQTAMFRRTWAFAPRAVVRHLHPDWKTAEMDSTYEKGKARFAEDGTLYRSRRWMWGK